MANANQPVLVTEILRGRRLVLCGTAVGRAFRVRSVVGFLNSVRSEKRCEPLFTRSAAKNE